MLLRRKISLLFFCSAIVFSFSQNVDPLKTLLQTTKDDTIRCKLLEALIEHEPNETVWIKYNDEENQIARRLIRSENARMKQRGKTFLASTLGNKGFLHSNKGEMDSAQLCFEKCLNLNIELNDRHAEALTLNNLGGILKRRGEVMKGLDYYKKSLQIEQQLKNKQGIARQLNNIGFTYNSLGDVSKALDYYQQSLKVYEELGDKAGIANEYNNFADIYRTQQDLEKALEYNSKSLKIREELGDISNVAISLNNIGSTYNMMNQEEKALEHFRRALAINEKLGHKRIISIGHSNIGGIYRVQGKIDEALEQYRLALKIREEIGDKDGIAQSMNELSYIYARKKNFGLAAAFADSALKFSRELGFPLNIMKAELRMYEVKLHAGDFKSALEHYEQHILYRDSLSNEKTKKASVRKQLQMEYEKQAAADSVAHAKENEIKSAELNRQSAEIRAKKNQQYALFGGLFLVCLFSLFMFNRFKVTQKQKAVIEHQKEIVEEQKKLVEEKQLEIVDSIKYARRIQLAQIPSEKRIQTMIDKTKPN
jgi:tetratricopeptide (TPR) repeat protein